MITGVVLARNEAANIVDCLRHLRPHVEELLLIDMESTDTTVELSRPFVDHVLSHPVVSLFDAARNVAIGAARFDWLWFIDADERVPDHTGQIVRDVIRKRGHEFAAISIPFKTYFCGRWIQHSGWWPGYTMPRVLKRGHFRFAERLHGGVEFEGNELRFPPDPELAIQHFSYRSIEHYIDKFNRYTSAESQQLARDGATLDWKLAVKAMVRDWWLYYERNSGHRDGYHGWLLAWLAGQYRWFSHAKLLDQEAIRDTALTAEVPLGINEIIEVMQEELAILRGNPSSESQFSLLFRSPLRDPSGYADDGRALLKSLAAGKFAVKAQEIPWSKTRAGVSVTDEALIRALERATGTTQVTITNCIPTLCEPDSTARYNVLRTTFETDRIPSSWLGRLEKYDEIWVCSTFNERIFRQCGVAPEKIKVVPGYLDTSWLDAASEDCIFPLLLSDKFVFLSIFDWQLRKGWDVLLRAYAREFAPSDQVGLLLKISRQHGHSLDSIRAQADEIMESLGQSLSNRTDIVIWDDVLSQQQVASLYKKCQAFVLASRGEGWGRPYIEAMAMGLPTIGTRGSGNDDFMTDDNSFLVPTRQVSVPQAATQEIPVYLGHQWCEPDEEVLRAQMRFVFTNPDRATKKGRVAAADVRTGFSLAAGAATLAGHMERIRSRLISAAPPTVRADQIRIELEGELFAGHSFSNINERLARGWEGDPTLAVSLKRTLLHPTMDRQVPDAHELLPLIHRPFEGGPQVVIRHAFPPNWAPPVNARWVHIQPWEFGVLPVDWIRPLRDLVDEVWVPSRYVRDVYVNSGIAVDKIHVIPWGIDPEVYRPDVPPLHLAHSDCFRFLYVGGTVERKGFDYLWQAFREEFSPDECVCLVVKDVGAATFYRIGNWRDQVLEAIAANSCRVLYLDQDMTEGQRASLYAACDCFVAPYRGEGFGLPVLEAMACGLAPIVPRGGPTDDFTTESTAYYIPAAVVESPHDWRMRGTSTEFAIDIVQLRRAMRSAYENREELQEKRKAAAHHARSHFTWQHTIQLTANRLHLLASQQPSQKSAEVVDPFLPPRDRSRQPALDLTVCVWNIASLTELADCLSSWRPFVREVNVVVERAAGERTRALAAEYGANVIDANAVNDWSSMLNCALSKSTSEWVLILEAGERIQEPDLRRLCELLRALPPAIGGVAFRMPHRLPIGLSGLPLSFVRMVRNDHRIKLQGQAGELVESAIQFAGLRLFETDIAVIPINSNSIDPHFHHFQSNLRHADSQSHPRESLSFLNLGLAHWGKQNLFHAECYLWEALKRLDTGHRWHIPLCVLLAQLCRAIGDPIRAEDYARQAQIKLDDRRQE